MIVYLKLHSGIVTCSNENNVTAAKTLTGWDSEYWLDQQKFDIKYVLPLPSGFQMAKI